MCLHQSHVFARLYEARRLCVKHDSEQYFKPSGVVDENSDVPPNGMSRLHQPHSSVRMKIDKQIFRKETQKGMISSKKRQRKGRM